MYPKNLIASGIECMYIVLYIQTMQGLVEVVITL